MTRYDFQRISALRVREASALLRLGHFHGAYYLAGYAIECALKACIAKRTRRFDFPEKKVANEAWKHDLEALLGTAGLAVEFADETKRSKPLELNWNLVKDWSEESRYMTDLTEHDARQLLSACKDRTYGVLPWIKKRW